MFIRYREFVDPLRSLAPVEPLTSRLICLLSSGESSADGPLLTTLPPPPAPPPPPPPPPSMTCAELMGLSGLLIVRPKETCFCGCLAEEGRGVFL